MNYEPDNESGATTPLILRPLTPDEWERNQRLYDELLDYVFDVESEPKKQINWQTYDFLELGVLAVLRNGAFAGSGFVLALETSFSKIFIR